MMNILNEVTGCKTIAISGHIRPDGDCIGSVMAMYLYLKKNLKDVKIIPMIETPAPIFNCISGIENIVTSFNPDVDVFDAFIGLDSSTTDRYGDALRFFETAKKTIIIDHHISNGGFGDVSYIDPKASSACELVFDTFDKELIDEDIAKALYIGIIHDTGVLQYSNVSPKTLKTVASLIEFGFDFSALIDSTFYEKTFVQNKMLAEGLMISELLCDGKFIVAKIDQKTMDKYNATTHDLDGIVNQLRYTKGVEVAIFMYELSDNVYKVSLRSNGLIDVSAVSLVFDGGGHKKAAGFSLEGEYESCVKKVVDELLKQLN